MEEFLTDHGPYYLFYAENGRTVNDCIRRFQDAAAQGATLIYADETLGLPDGTVKTVRKPDWSPDTLFSCNYIGSPFAAPAPLCEACGLPLGDSPQDRYAFLLRLTRRADPIVHIPAVLFNGTAEQPPTRTKLISDALCARKINALVTCGQLPGSFAVRYAIERDTQISCIVISTGHVDAVRRTLESIVCRGTYPHTEFIICDGSPADARKEAYYAALSKNGAATIVRVFREENVPKLINLATEHASGDALLFLPSGMALGAHDALDRMLEYVQLAHIGTVGGQVVHEGKEKPGIIHNAHRIDRVMMTRADYFIKQGGFDITFERTGYIKAFSVLSAALGKWNLVTPYATFFDDNVSPDPAPTKRNQKRLDDIDFAWPEDA